MVWRSRKKKVVVSVLRIATAVATALILAGCSGGHSSSTPPPPTKPAIVYPSSLDLPVNSPMVPVTPRVTGTLTLFSSSPALAQGLVLDPDTGTISGTPANISAKSQYTITATGNSGSATATLWISVHDSAPVVMYESPVYSVTADVPASMSPTNPAPGGGTALSWSISPAVPAGLSFDPATGQISGTATTPGAPATFKVTATNQVGSSSGTVTIGVYPNVSLLEVSLEGLVNTLRFSGSRVLAANDYQWVLKDYTTGKTLVYGNSACLTTANPPCGEATADMIGGVVLIDSLGGFSVRSATDGHVLWNESSQPIYWVRLAMDASYVVAGTKNGLIIWPIDGSTSMTVSGDYSQAIVAAAPGFVQVANGPAGANVIEQVAVGTGARTVSPAYTGTFQSWFQDGSAFASGTDTTLSVYSKQAVLLESLPITEPTLLAGLGQWFWTKSPDTGFRIYELGASSTPVYSNLYLPLLPQYAAFTTGSGVALLLPQDDGSATPAPVMIIDLSTGSPVITTAPVPLQFGAYAWSAAATSTSSWVLGSLNGLIYDGASPAAHPRFLSHGDTLSVAGGGNSFSIATADGTVSSFDLSTYTLTSTVSASPDYMISSADGSTLAIRTGTFGSENVALYAPATGALIYHMSLPSDAHAYQLLLSTPGTLLTVDYGYTSATNPCNAMILSIPDGTTTLCYKNLPEGTSRVFHPDLPLAEVNGMVPDSGSDPKFPLMHSVYTIYSNDFLLSSGAGWLVPGWLDDTHFITAGYREDDTSLYYVGPDLVVDGTGTVFGTYSLDLLGTAVADAHSLSLDGTGIVFDAYTGAVKWANGSATTGAGWVRGRFYIFKYNGELYAEPWQ
jgi:hypothetical protein